MQSFNGFYQRINKVVCDDLTVSLGNCISTDTATCFANSPWNDSPQGKHTFHKIHRCINVMFSLSGSTGCAKLSGDASETQYSRFMTIQLCLETCRGLGKMFGAVKVNEHIS